MSGSLYTCFRGGKVPFLSISPVNGCDCSSSSNWNSEYMAAISKYTAEVNRTGQINNYDRYHRFAAYGKQRMSKRILAPYCGDIYNFRRKI